MIELPGSCSRKFGITAPRPIPRSAVAGSSVSGERHDTRPARRARRNRGTEQRSRRYTIDPRDYLRLERLADETGLTVVGIYHSHPDHPAVPSEFDREHALPYFHYLIVAVEAGRAGDFACWVLNEDRGSFERVPHRLSDSEGD